MIKQKNYIKYSVLIIGLIGYTFSGINWNIGIATWIAPIFLLYFTKNARWFDFLIFFLGMAVSAAVSKTAENLSGLFVVTLITGISYGIMNTLPYIIEKFLHNKRNPFYNTFIFPSAIVLFEYLFSLLYGIWSNPSVTQYYSSNLIQFASIFGVFGISFLIAWFASIINWIINSGFETKYIKKGLGIYGLAFIAVLLFGAIRTNISPKQNNSVKVAAIVSETNIHEVFKTWEDDILELSKNYDTPIPDEVYSKPQDIKLQIEKTKEALKIGAKIVVWNEISLILNPTQKDSLIRQIKMLCIENNTYVLLAFLEKNTTQFPKPFNNRTVLVTSKGEIGWEYIKSR